MYHSHSDVLRRLADLLATHRPLLVTHPNDCDLSVIPETWTASSEELAQYYTTGSGIDLPQDLKELIDDIRTLQIPRAPVTIPNGIPLPTRKGMSPKKLHEVQRMANYVKSLVDSVYKKFQPQGRLHIVDVGAGQGYLTRALGGLFPDAKLLALDADHEQTEGAERRGKSRRQVDFLTAELNCRIDHRTVLITPNSLLEAVDGWVNEDSAAKGFPVPVLFVALHACGSLTPDMLRCFLSRISKPLESDRKGWYPLSIATVGCCYNLMYPEDYPLSSVLRSYAPASENPLTSSSSHLAAQMPMTWLHKLPGASHFVLQPSVKLATQKVVWRALLQFALENPFVAIPISNTETEAGGNASMSNRKTKLSSDVPVKWWTQPRRGVSSDTSPLSLPQQSPNPSFVKLRPTFDRLPKAKPTDFPLEVQLQGVGQTEAAVRLGKLPYSAYHQGWAHFLKIAGEKLGVAWEFGNADDLRDPALERRIEVLHTVRCFLGSAIESAILLDRLEWIREQLEVADMYSMEAKPTLTIPHNWDAALVNLFDQTVGSGRNIGLIIAPIIPPYT